MPGEEVRTALGCFLLWDRPVRQILQDSENLHSRYSLVFDRAGFAADPASYHPDIQAVLEADPARVFYLDIETAGLASGPVFLVGLLLYQGRSLVIRQLLARDYSEEPALLTYLSNHCLNCDALVTFNGKSFDLRYLQERFISTGLPPLSREFLHLDLLHEGRRHWRDLLPDCRLQTLERFISGRTRPDDIPGERIPAAYHDFVRTGDARELRDIFHHNAMDLITMVEVLLHILQGRSGSHPESEVLPHF